MLCPQEPILIIIMIQMKYSQIGALFCGNSTVDVTMT